MRLSYIALPVGICSVHIAAEDDNTHGEGVEGTVQGPVAFLWPKDRPWSAATDNIGPCGNPDGVVNRTNFPISQGSVALIIANEAWNVAFSIAYENNPVVQAQFVQQVVNVAVVGSGHQCYKIDEIPDTVTAGSNATIQIKYWLNMENELSGRNQTFSVPTLYVKLSHLLRQVANQGDISPQAFIEAAAFSTQVPCFNVTSSDFNPPESSFTSTADEPNNTSAEDNSTAHSISNPDSSLTKSAIIGVAVGMVVASFLFIAVVGSVVLRGRRVQAFRNEEQQNREKFVTEVTFVDSHPS